MKRWVRRAAWGAVLAGLAWFRMGEAVAGEPKPGKSVIPDAASEGSRDLEKMKPLLRTFVTAQPYGKDWKDIVKVEPPPKDKTGLADAKTHESLKNDPIEMQQQSQFIEETGTEVRFGFASIRGVRVYRYAKLDCVQLVIEMIGRGERDRFKQDVEALAAAWQDPAGALELKGTFKATRNDLVEQKKLRPKDYPAPPLRIELKPVVRGSP